MVGLAGVVLAAIVVLATGAALTAWGSSRWAAGTRELERRLELARVPPPVARYDSARELDGLPAPVQRYFRTVLTEGQPIVAAVTLAHRGRFNLAEQGERWVDFTSAQRVVTRRPGFVWDARMSLVALLPGLRVHVHDAYVAGEGLLRPSLLGLVALADLRGTPELAHGELMRFFAEAAWYPTALLPSQGVRWSPVDERSARATLVDGAVEVTLTFDFADDGNMRGVRADGRGRMVGGRTVTTPWAGRWWDWQLRQGMRVPIRGEVAWLTPEGRLTYWEGTITSLEFEFAP